jgi:hypothetical protein
MAGKIPLKTSVIVFLCCGIFIILSSCMVPVDIEAFLKSDEVGKFINDTVNIPPEEKNIVKIDNQTGDDLNGGNRIITGLKNNKYYMVEKEIAPEGAPEPTNHYPMYVTEYTSPDPAHSLIPGQLIDDLGLITRISAGKIIGLTNLNKYTVRAATPFFEGLSFTYSDSAGTQDQTVSVSNGAITLPPSKGNGNITLKNLDGQFNGYEVMGVSVTPAAFPAGSPFSNLTKKTIGKTVNTVTSFQLEGAGTEVDYIFVKPDVPANFHVLKVIIEATPPAVITEKAIQGVTVPAAGGADVTVITNTQYTGTVKWSPALDNGKFKPEIPYTAAITLEPKAGFTLDGVTDTDFFTVAGATPVTYDVDTKTVTAVFPATGKLPITITAIQGVTVPETGKIPVTDITANEQYSGTVSWVDLDNGKFKPQTQYTATITLTAKTGYTLDGVTGANFFTVAGATTVTYNPGFKTVTAVFPATGALPPPATGNFAITFTIDDNFKGITALDKNSIVVTSISKSALFASSSSESLVTIKLTDGGYNKVISWNISGTKFDASNNNSYLSQTNIANDTLVIKNTALFWNLLSGDKITINVTVEKGGVPMTPLVPITFTLGP